MTEGRTLFWCLLGVIVSLLLVGIVSGTPLRHVVQVLPACLMASAAWRGLAWSRAGALPIFLIWLFLMILIWLYLLGIAKVISGTFSATEIALTIAIIIAVVVGIITVFRGRQTTAWPARLLAFVTMAVMQVAALWLSFQPAVARR